MRTIAPRRFVAGWLLAAACVAACFGPLQQTPKAVQSALGPFLQAGYTCAAPSADHSAFLQWQCDHTSADGVRYSIILDADDSGVKQVLATVDQTPAAAMRREVALDFFMAVADMNLGGASKAIKDWVNRHLADGGQEHLGSLLLTLDNLRPVDYLTVFSVGGSSPVGYGPSRG